MKDTISKLLKAITGAITVLFMVATFVLCIVMLGLLAYQFPYIALTALVIIIFVCLVVYFMISQRED